jgi:hypothetical protein
MYASLSPPVAHFTLIAVLVGKLPMGLEGNMLTYQYYRMKLQWKFFSLVS